MEDNKLTFIKLKEDSKIFYSNSIDVVYQYYDFLLTFFNQSLDRTENVVTDKELCRVFLSPQHAKVLNTLLTKYVAEYEQKFGSIKLPEDLLHSLVGEKQYDKNNI